MSSIDNLEKIGAFPSRFRLEPTVRVAWLRREVERWLTERAHKRVHHAPKN
jgi:predicted DNA-binding transcriptional regulator AlpA